jgi:tyrosyl-tRNA synthetase
MTMTTTDDYVNNYKMNFSKGLDFCSFHKDSEGEKCTYLNNEAFFKKSDLLKMTIEHKECADDVFLMCQDCYDNDFDKFLG